MEESWSSDCFNDEFWGSSDDSLDEAPAFSSDYLRDEWNRQTPGDDYASSSDQSNDLSFEDARELLFPLVDEHNRLHPETAFADPSSLLAHLYRRSV